MAEPTPATGAPDLGRTAYEAENAWLSKIMPGAQHPSWDELDPEYQEMYRRIAGAVAAAERERIAKLADERRAHYPADGQWASTDLRWKPELRSFAGLIREPVKEGGDEQEAGNG